MTGAFELETTADQQFMFNLKAANGEIIFTSQRYTTKQSAQKGIESTRTNATADERYDRLQSKSQQPYFVLKAPNNEIIGKSQMYSSPSAMEQGIRAVKRTRRTQLSSTTLDRSGSGRSSSESPTQIRCPTQITIRAPFLGP